MAASMEFTALSYLHLSVVLLILLPEDRPILYSYFRSSCSWRVRIALALKSVDYEYRAVHLVKDGGEQHAGDYQKLNPMEQVPALVINGQTLTQSVAMLEYLEEVYPDPPLLPKDPIQRAQVRSLVETIASGIQPIQNLSVLQYVGNEKKMEWGHHFIDVGFKALEQMLSKTAGTYCYGDVITLADLCLVPQVYNANRFKVDMEQFPIIQRILDNVSKLDAFVKADPAQQPDFPAEA